MVAGEPALVNASTVLARWLARYLPDTPASCSIKWSSRVLGSGTRSSSSLCFTRGASARQEDKDRVLQRVAETVPV